MVIGNWSPHLGGRDQYRFRNDPLLQCDMCVRANNITDRLIRRDGIPWQWLCFYKSHSALRVLQTNFIHLWDCVWTELSKDQSVIWMIRTTITTCVLEVVHSCRIYFVWLDVHVRHVRTRQDDDYYSPSLWDHSTISPLGFICQYREDRGRVRNSFAIVVDEL